MSLVAGKNAIDDDGDKNTDKATITTNNRFLAGENR